jgi:hypothetical protein
LGAPKQIDELDIGERMKRSFLTLGPAGGVPHDPAFTDLILTRENDAEFVLGVLGPSTAHRH